MKNIAMCLICGVLLTATVVATQEEAPSVRSLPSSVIRTVPECGDVNVDASVTTQIKVTFSKEMMDKTWSWSQISNDTFPQIIGKPKYIDDNKTCVVDVKLQPKKTYAIWLNSQKFDNFKDAGGKSAVPYLLVFQTK
jgi:RNA polymerase sigma-70 factor (ECF subfamily)